MNTMKKHSKLIALLCATLFATSGCLLSTQYLFTILRPGPYHYTTGSNFDAVNVDLSENEDFQDNKENIKRIESIRFGGIVTNNLGQADIMSMYISAFQYSSYAELLNAVNAGNAYTVLSDMPVPARTSPTTVTAEDTDPYLNTKKADFDKIAQLVMLGEFFTYATGGNANFDLIFESCLYHIAFTATN